MGKINHRAFGIKTVEDLWDTYKDDGELSLNQDMASWDWKPKYLVINNEHGIKRNIALREWCEENCKGEYYGWSWCYWLFENEDDALYFKLTVT